MLQHVYIDKNLDLPLNARLDHITGHEFEALLQVLAEFGVRPVQVPDERLQSVQLPEEVFRGCTAVTLLLEALVDGLGDRRLHQVNIAHHQRCEGFPQVRMEAPILQIICRSRRLIKSFISRESFTIHAKVVVENLEERKGIPRVWGLLSEHLVHVDGEQGPEDLCMLHQQVAEPRERLRKADLGRWSGAPDACTAMQPLRRFPSPKHIPLHLMHTTFSERRSGP
jgi:hypothetical protein